MDTRKGGQASGKIINETYAEYQQCELNEKDEKTAKALGKYVIKLYSNGISQVVKITDIKKLRQDIENDPIIKDQMADLGCLLVCTLGNFLVPVLVAAHTVNNLGPSDGQDLENEVYDSD